MGVLLSVLLLVTAILDAKERQVVRWLLLLDVGLLLVYVPSLTYVLAGAFVVPITSRTTGIGAADRLLFPALVAAFGFWPVGGLVLGELYKKVRNKNSYPLLPWLIGASLVGTWIEHIDLHLFS